MKRTLLAIIVCMIATNTNTQAQTLIHYWNFNTFTATYHNPNIPTLPADYSVMNVAKTGLAYELVPGAPSTYTGYVDDVVTAAIDSDIYNLRTVGGVATPAGNGYRFRKPVDSAYLVFFIPSTGYKNLTFSYAVENSSTSKGIETNNFSYSTDSGATWKTAGLDHLSDSTNSITAYTGTQPVFKLITVNFTSADTTVNNNPRLAFRIIPSGNTTGSSGNNRFDNITLDGTAITTGVANIAAPNSTISLYPNPAATIINIVTAIATEKTIRVYNVAGQVVYTAVVNSRMATVPIANLSAGMYQVLVHDNTTGENQTAKFAKQ